jgi:glycosyltransferase involved in cell wall biosynthesis
MDNILYISGDGIWNSGQNKIYHKHFSIHSTKNYFISRELKSIVSHCEVINFSWWFGHPRFIVKLESSGLRGTTRIKIITTKIINLISRFIIYWKIIINSVDLIIFSDNLFFLDILLIKSIKKLSSSKLIFLSGVSPKYLFPQSHKECIPYFDNIFISDPGHEAQWKQYGATNINVLPLSASCPNTFQRIVKKNINREKYDIVFIGRLDLGGNEHRIKILNFLLSKGVEIKIWTLYMSKKYLNKYPLVKNNIMGSAYGEEMVKILVQSKIALNIHDPSQPCGGNLRLFEIPGAKTLQIADKCPSDWFIDGHEIVLYKNKEDFLRKINYFVDNDEERERIAKNGYGKLVREHQYKHRVKKLLNIIHH